MPQGIASAMAWKTDQHTIDVDLTKAYSQFTTDAAVLLDKDPDTGITTNGRIFWCVLCHLVFFVTGANCKYPLHTTHLVNTRKPRPRGRYFGVKLTRECSNATFSFTMGSNMHYLRTAYSQDGKTWTCESDFLDPEVREDIAACL